MKIQIRRDVFETNSSSVHTLSLKKLDETSLEGIFDKINSELKAYILVYGIKFGKNYNDWDEYYNDNITSPVIKEFKYKCDEFWESVLGESNGHNLSFLFIIMDAAKKLGKKLNINIEFCTEPEYVSNCYYNVNSLITEIDTKEKLLRYLGFPESNLYSYDNNYYNRNNLLSDDVEVFDEWD